ARGQHQRRRGAVDRLTRFCALPQAPDPCYDSMEYIFVVAVECRFAEVADMLAAWYDRQGPAADVPQVGELPTPEPGPGEVRVRIRFSGINPGDTKKRSGWQGNPMSFPRIIPHSDGGGVIDAV